MKNGFRNKKRGEEFFSLILLLAMIASAVFVFYLILKTDMGDSNIGEKSEVQFTEIKKGFSSEVSNRKFMVIKDSERWSSLLNGIPSQAVDSSVDFDESMVLVAFQGEKPTGGYSIEITRIDNTKRSVNVYVTEVSPGNDCITTQAVTQPFHIVTTKTIDKEVKFISKMIVADC